MKLVGVCVAFIAILWMPLMARQADFNLVTDIGTSARMISLGRIEGFDTSAASIFENPAALSYVGESSISLFRTTLVNEFHYNNMAIAIETPVGKLGFGYMENVTYDLYETIAVTGNHMPNDKKEIVAVGTFDYKSQVYKLAYQWDVLDDLFMGMTYSFYQVAFETERGQGANLDFGLMYHRPNYRLSFLLKHLVPGAQIVYDSGTREYLPLMGMVSGAYQFRPDVEGYFQYKARYQNKSEGRGVYHLGAYGIRYNPDYVPYLSFMIGYRDDLILDDIRSNISLGIELSFYGFRAHYAYEKADVPGFNNKSYFSIAINY